MGLGRVGGGVSGRGRVISSDGDGKALVGTTLDVKNNSGGDKGM